MTDKLNIMTKAPEFDLIDTRGQPVCLANFLGEKYVVLVLTRGFM
jgi:peroxiredoxin